MKKIITILLLSCLLPACASRRSVPQPTIVIADPGLAAALSAAAGAPADQFTIPALRKITKLDASGRGIKNLSGIEYCTRMFELNLANNDLTDIGPLAALRDLVVLDLSHNRISDLTALSRLFLLSDIYLKSNQISDLSPLSRNLDGGGMRSSPWIYLEDNPLGQTAFDVDIPHLRLFGVTISCSQGVFRPTGRTYGPATAPRWPF